MLVFRRKPSATDACGHLSLLLTALPAQRLEIFHNRQRQNSSLSMLTPVEFEARYQPMTAA